MTGGDVSTSDANNAWRNEVLALLAWIESTLIAKRKREPLTSFEVKLLERAEKIGEM